jgi:chromosomal replication initiation ATPase DnaA
MTELESFINRTIELSDLNTIQDFISKYNLNQKSRRQDVLFVRYELIRMMRKKTKLSLSEIGKYFNLKHCTVINALTACDNMYRFGHYKYHEIVRKYLDEIENIKFN